MLVATSLLILLAFPTLAQDEDPTLPVTDVTFRLTLEGRVPPGEQFNLSYGSALRGSPRQFYASAFCGAQGGFNPQPRPRCKGGGTVYTLRIRIPTGHTVRYEYSQTYTSRRGPSTILAGERKVGEGRLTVAAAYDVADETALPLALPRTGGGGMSQEVLSGPCMAFSVPC
jgi:hypothetical protein